MVNYKKIFALQEKNKSEIKKNINVSEKSGIYFFTREEEGIKYAYVGQAKHLLSRLAQHLAGYQHIDLSLKKHGFYSKENPTGYKISCIEVKEEELDESEQKYIKIYAQAGYQLRNKTLGSQHKGKKGLDNTKETRGYRDGLKKGYENARKEIAHLFALHLDVVTKSEKPNKNQERALVKFVEFASYEGRKEGKDDRKRIKKVYKEKKVYTEEQVKEMMKKAIEYIGKAIVKDKSYPIKCMMTFKDAIEEKSVSGTISVEEINKVFDGIKREFQKEEGR